MGHAQHKLLMLEMWLLLFLLLRLCCDQIQVAMDLGEGHQKSIIPDEYCYLISRYITKSMHRFQNHKSGMCGIVVIFC